MVMISRSSEAGTPPRFTSLPPAPPAEKSQPLHNFSLPCLKWGSQRLLRCMKVNRTGQIIRSSDSEPETDGQKQREHDNRAFRKAVPSAPLPKPPTFLTTEKSPPAREDSDLGIEEVREKLLVHLRTAAKKMRLQVAEEGEEDESSARPWNLRTRRSACKANGEIGESRRDIPASPPENQMKSSRLRSLAAEKNGEKERSRFSVALLKEEIEEDFFIITGSKPARRPKKRARVIQKQLDMSFPGLWLSEITLDTYKVPDFHEPGMR